jgi:hypothetical protein
LLSALVEQITPELEQQQLIQSEENKSLSIFIGAQCLSDKKSLQEAEQELSQAQNVAKISQKIERLKATIATKEAAGVLDPYLEDENYKTSVLNPAKFLTGNPEWSVEINKHFLIGAILSNRPITLATNPEYLKMSEWFSAKNGTIYELLTLMDNGYQFSFDTDTNKIVAKPTEQFIDASKIDLSKFEHYVTIKKEQDPQKQNALTKQIYNTSLRESLENLNLTLKSLYHKEKTEKKEGESAPKKQRPT